MSVDPLSAVTSTASYFLARYQLIQSQDVIVDGLHQQIRDNHNKMENFLHEQKKVQDQDSEWEHFEMLLDNLRSELTYLSQEVDRTMLWKNILDTKLPCLEVQITKKFLRKRSVCSETIQAEGDAVGTVRHGCK